MTSKSKKALIDSIYLVLAWHLTWLGILQLFMGAQSMYVYADISAWWCTLYVGYIREVGWEALLPVVAIEVSIKIIFLTIGLGKLLTYKDLYTLSDLTVFIFILNILVASFVCFASTILINIAVRYGIKRKEK